MKMSEVDRLSTSGTYPALALTDRRRSREEPGSSSTGTDGRGPGRSSERDPARPDAGGASGAGRPDALIDEYA